MEQFVFIIMAFLGLIMKTLIKVQSAIRDSKNTPDKFSWKFYFKDNWISLSISVVSIIVLILGVEDIEGIIGEKYMYLKYFIIGFLNYEIVRGLLKKFEKKFSNA